MNENTLIIVIAGILLYSMSKNKNKPVKKPDFDRSTSRATFQVNSDVAGFDTPYSLRWFPPNDNYAIEITKMKV